MATLYEMTGVAMELYAMFENDEIDEQVMNDTLEGIGVEGKLEDYCKVIRQLEADAFVFKTEKLRLAERQSKAEKSVERLKNAISMYLTAKGSKSEKAGIFDISLRKSESVVIDDIYKVDEQYVTYQEPKPDRTAIKKAINSGAKIEGAHIEIKQNVNIK